MPSPASTRCCTRWLLKARHQIVENPLGPLPPVVAILKLLHVLLKVLRRNVDVRPANRQLQTRPKPLERVDVAGTPHILTRTVIDSPVIKAEQAQSAIGPQFGHLS